jgi:hypothetical protein
MSQLYFQLLQSVTSPSGFHLISTGISSDEATNLAGISRLGRCGC